jgi:SAM-dependent methyltransferase
LTDPSQSGAAGQYPAPRTEIVNLIDSTIPQRQVIDIGCGNAATARAIKDRFPLAYVIGVEPNPAAAKLAETRLDRIIQAPIDMLDYDALDIKPHTIDTALFLDVLEHLYDPWTALERLRPRLASDAQIIASIPNIRNYWILSNLITKGEFSYGPNGLLDITHIRFFTRREIERLFVETGYRIISLINKFDERVPIDLHPKTEELQKFALTNLTDDDIVELRTFQFYVIASPK